MLKSAIRSTIGATVGTFAGICNLVIGLSLLWRTHPSLSGARAVLVYYDGGFGHSIIGPDALRRLHPRQRVAVIWFLERRRHNPYFATLWSDVQVIVLPIIGGGWLGRRVGWSAVAQKRWLAGVYLRLLHRWLPNTELRTMDEFWSTLPPAGPKLPLFGKERDYFVLCQSVPAPPARLPASVRDRVLTRIRAKCGDRRLCCVYLRHRVTGYVETDRRSGVPFEALEPAIELLFARGWAVLITGDRPVPGRVLSVEDAPLCDASVLGVPRSIFQLFAQSEADFFVGESGGGMFLPTINGIPTLLINAFPLGWGMPNATVLWKVPLDSDLRPLPGRLALAQLATEYDPEGVQIRENTPQELREAVADALDWLDAGRPSARTDLFDDLPAGALLRTISVRPSPAWPCSRIAPGASSRALLPR